MDKVLAGADIRVRRARASDLTSMTDSFKAIGKDSALFRRYLSEQGDDCRAVLIGFNGEELAGYITVNWRPSYPPLATSGAPELQDLNVLPAFRRRGIGTALIRGAELEARNRSATVGIAVGLHPGYNAAQRLYVQLGYVPDGNGITVKDVSVNELQSVVLNDDVVLHFEKALPSLA